MNPTLGDPNSNPISPQGPSSLANPQSTSTRNFSSTGYSTGAPPVPQISTTFHQSDSTSRPTTMSASHSYSRSSPAANVEHKYTPFPNTPESSKYSSTSSSKHYIPHTPTGAPSQSPLALTDIRPPRTELHMGDDLTSPSAALLQEPSITQVTSCYNAPWPIYAYDWCKWPVSAGNGVGKMAICSYLEDSHNYIQILDTHLETTDSFGDLSMGFTRTAEATCAFPVTRVLWEPPQSAKQTTSLCATSGDHLRLWQIEGPNGASAQSNTIHRHTNSSGRSSTTRKLGQLALLSNSKTPEHTAPLTSLDWNDVSPKLIITSSIDTTCTIWDIPTLTAKTQLIAHDKEVFDVRFCAGSVDQFVSCGADGSVRMFDLRSLEHSTIIYEPSERSEKADQSPTPLSPTSGQSPHVSAPPLLRIAASPHDSHLLATFAQDSKIVRVLDHRQPGQALLELHGHSASVNSIDWSPTRRGMLASGGDDSQVLYWDLINPSNSATLDSVAGPGTGMTGPIGGMGGLNGLNMFGNMPENGGVGSSSGATSSFPSDARGPAAAWRCDFEVSNLSWSPQSGQSSSGGEWVGVTGGKGVWAVKV